MRSQTKQALAAQSFKEEDLLYLRFPLVHEGVNLNGDEFTAEEMEKGYHTLIGTPLDQDHSKSVGAIVGKNYDAQYELDSDGKGVIYVDAYVYANHYPDIATKIMDGVINAVSMECMFGWAERAANKRTFHDIKFIGSGLVRIPGDPNALIDPVGYTKASKKSFTDEHGGLYIPDTRKLYMAIAAAIAALEDLD